MNPRIEDWDEAFLDIEDYQVERAATWAALDAILRARRFGTQHVIWEEGRVKSLGPEETKPREQFLLENLERLNRRIAELQTQSGQPFSLNERPDK